MKDVLLVLRQIYQNKKYILISLITGIISFFIFYKLTLATTANHSLKIFIMMSGYNYTYFTFLTLALTSVLFGVYLSIVVYRFNLIKCANKNKKSILGSFFGFLGFFAGAFGTGCPTCGSVVFALIGMPLALMYFPFKGMELRVLSVGILFISIYILSRSIIRCKFNNLNSGF